MRNKQNCLGVITFVCHKSNQKLLSHTELNVTTRPDINTKIKKHFSKSCILESVFLSGKEPQQPRLSAEGELHALTTILPHVQPIQLKEV